MVCLRRFQEDHRCRWLCFGLMAVVICMVFMEMLYTPLQEHVGILMQAGKYQSESLGGESRGGESLGGESLGEESLGGESLGGESLGGESRGEESLGGESLRKESLGGDSLKANLRRIITIVRTYTSELKSLRDEMLNSMASNLTEAYRGNISHVLNGYDANYLKNVTALTSAKTAFLRVPGEIMSVNLAQRYYNYAAVDCQWLENHSSYGKGRAKVLFNSNCTKDPNEHWSNRSYPLQYTALGVSLPNGLSSKFPDLETPIWTFAHVIKDALVTSDGDVIFGSFKLVPQRCSQDLSRKVPSLKATATAPLHQEILTVAQFWGSGFFHGLLENLPRLAAYVEFLNDHPEVKIHVSAEYRFLPLLGVKDVEKRLVRGNIRARVLYMPTGGPCGRPPLFPTQLLSMRLRATLPPSVVNTPPDTVVLIRRSHKRFFSNHDAILDMLKRHAEPRGLRVAVYGDNPVPGVEDTAEMFGRALIVVAPHGAGESNLVFSRPGTVLIEGLCYDELKLANLCYRNMAQVLGFRYYGLLFKQNCMEIKATDIEVPLKAYIGLYERHQLL